jgi:Fur family ferric uptake transcriptional regulator
MTALKPSSAHSQPTSKASGIEARCAATGMRMTEQRRVIARVLAKPWTIPTSRNCIAAASQVDDKISISTGVPHGKAVRGLPDIIERHDFREGRARYEQMRDSHHDHLINLRDGKVIEFTSEEIEKLQAESPASSATSWSTTGWSSIACRSTTTKRKALSRCCGEPRPHHLRLRRRRGRQR